jgi:uncharacterized RDD family membrane protein YckC
MGIRPVRSDRAALSFWRALARAGAVSAASMMSWLGLLDSLWCLWDENCQCVHDKVADTVVITDR